MYSVCRNVSDIITLKKHGKLQSRRTYSICDPYASSTIKKKKPKCHRNVASVSAVMFSTAARISAFGFFTCRGDHLFDNKFSAVIWYTETNASVSAQL